MVAMKNWSKGDRVVQPTYGTGTLVEVNEHHTVIDFDEHGRRTFATRLVALQSSSEPAPAKAPRKRATKAKTKEPYVAKIQQPPRSTLYPHTTLFRPLLDGRIDP